MKSEEESLGIFLDSSMPEGSRGLASGAPGWMLELLAGHWVSQVIPQVFHFLLRKLLAGNIYGKDFYTASVLPNEEELKVR